MNFEFKPFKFCGIARSKIPEDLLMELRDSCLKVFNDKTIQLPLNQDLAGNIKHEYTALYNEEFNKFVIEMANFYIKQFSYKIYNFKVKRVWINFQKKHEFNPLHIHDSDLSFVLWIQIPYDLKQEKNNPSSIKSNCNVVSDFFYVEPYETKSIELSKENEGDIIMFDSRLQHGVYPFYTSDGYRISIAGNLVINDNNEEDILSYN